MVDLILAKGFDINVKTLRGSALHEAALCGKIEVVKSLLDNGINVEIRDDSDKTVLEVMDELKTQRTREVIHIILGDLLKMNCIDQSAFQFFYEAEEKITKMSCRLFKKMHVNRSLGYPAKVDSRHGNWAVRGYSTASDVTLRQRVPGPVSI